MSRSREFGWGVGLVGAFTALSGCDAEPQNTVPVATLDAGAVPLMDAGRAGRLPPDSGSRSADNAAVVDGGSPASEPSCVPDVLVACVDERGCVGVRTCRAETGALSPCLCEDSQAFLGDDPSASVGGPPTGLTSNISGALGDRCEDDGGCALGLGCLTDEGDDFFGFGGPAGGYCTAPCAEAEDCSLFQAEARCLRDPRDSSVGLCVRDCTTQRPEPGENKCFDRADVVCHSLAATGDQTFIGIRQDGFCRPLCGSDAECPEGRVCHPGGGVCVDAEDAPSGSEIGSQCTANEDCKSSLCEPVDDQTSVCSQLCVLGQSGGCGIADDDPQRGASCLTARVQANRFSEGEGDLGVCREVCTVDADCQLASSGWTCEALSPEAVEFFGVAGACIPPAASN